MIFFKHHSPLFRWKWLLVAGCKPIAKLKLPKSVSVALMLLLLTCFKVTATVNAQSVNLTLKDASLETVFNEIKKQTGFSFWYDKEEIDKTSKISVSIKNASIQQVLEQCLKGLPYSFEIFDKTVVIKRKNKPNNIQENSKALDFPAKGKVIDEQGSPMSGVTVRLKNTNKTTQTNSVGEFSIVVSDYDNLVLQFSYLGYSSIEKPVTRDVFLIVTLIQEASTLKSIEINAGYYTVKDRERTGSISRITSETIEKQPVLNPLQALQNRVAGVEITQLTGFSDAGFIVKIRGQNSLRSGNDPLYIIDGVNFPSTRLSTLNLNTIVGGQSETPTGVNPLSMLNPSDIQSIEILKDADATAIYGSRGANGVVLITTKKARAGETQVSANLSQSFSQVGHRLDMMNTGEYINMRMEAFKNDGLLPASTDYDVNGVWDKSKYTDWQEKLIGGTAIATNASLNISGGNKSLNFILSGNYLNEGSVFPGKNGFRRGGANYNLNFDLLNSRLKIALTTMYSITASNITTDFTQYIFLAPNIPDSYDEYGNLNWNYNGIPIPTSSNPMAQLLNTKDSSRDNLLGNANISFDIFKGLSFRSSLGYNQIKSEEIDVRPNSAKSPSTNPTTASRATLFGNNYVNSWIIEPQLNYNTTLSKGKLDLLAGMTFQKSTSEYRNIRASNFNSDELMKEISAASVFSISESSYIQYKYAAFFGRVNYNWQNKYLINLTWRRDGSSRFGPGKQFANFGAVGGAWIFSEENFIKRNLPFISFGKVRASYGVTGNDQIGDYKYMQLLTNNPSYQGVPTLLTSILANADYAWETNRKTEGAIELGLLKDRINLQIAYFRNRSSNQLVSLNLPISVGRGGLTGNLPAIVQNTGWEFEGTFKILDKKNWQWTANLNFTRPNNSLIDFPNLTSSAYSTSFIIGKPINSLKKYPNSWVDPLSGLYVYEDIDKNGVRNSSDAYLVEYLGQKYYGGISNTVTFKQISVDFLLSFVKQKGKSSLSTVADNPPGYFNSLYGNQPRFVLERWQKSGDDTSIPKFSTNSTSNFVLGSGLGSQSIGDASFLRLKNISIRYVFSNKWLPLKKIKALELNLQGQNLLTFTNYLGLDPENQFSNRLPPLRTVSVGLKITL
ncbi:SusC/RagA family TonB-linked outer membrane protein [Pedobacter helvus]|uniref:SusC/RagA family TonB-linked outer membrane protein n=1 Tax=Pedobacter helvus TaxID=2563444 RepID=A0ABW9JMB5_9SPHI|nr:SusC/RagA family TonB-linked outer membrane protein [Pedobacter ureilyticus]